MSPIIPIDKMIELQKRKSITDVLQTAHQSVKYKKKNFNRKIQMLLKASTNNVWTTLKSEVQLSLFQLERNIHLLSPITKKLHRNRLHASPTELIKNNVRHDLFDHHKI